MNKSNIAIQYNDITPSIWDMNLFCTRQTALSLPVVQLKNSEFIHINYNTEEYIYFIN